MSPGVTKSWKVCPLMFALTCTDGWSCTITQWLSRWRYVHIGEIVTDVQDSNVLPAKISARYRLPFQGKVPTNR